MLEIRTWILQTMLLCAKAGREDKSLRGTDGTGQHENFLLMHNNSVVIWGQSQSGFPEKEKKPPLEGTAVECSPTKNKNNYC